MSFRFLFLYFLTFPIVCVIFCIYAIYYLFVENCAKHKLLFLNKKEMKEIKGCFLGSPYTRAGEGFVKRVFYFFHFLNQILTNTQPATLTLVGVNRRIKWVR